MKIFSVKSVGPIGETLSTSDTIRYWVAGAGKVMVWIISRLFARLYGFLNGIIKSSPLRITETRLQTPIAPVLNPMLIDFF